MIMTNQRVTKIPDLGYGNGGGFNWDVGSIAFRDPFEVMLEKQKRREVERTRATKNAKRKTTTRDAQKDFHRKHG
jgi:hypothetical protein